MLTGHFFGSRQERSADSAAPRTLRDDQVGNPCLRTLEVQSGHDLEIDEADHVPVFLGHEGVIVGRREPRAIPFPMRGPVALTRREDFGPPELLQQGRDGLEVLFSRASDGDRAFGHSVLPLILDPAPGAGMPAGSSDQISRKAAEDGARYHHPYQAGVADHVTLGDGVVLAAGAGAIGDIPEGGRYLGFPARPAFEGKRIWILEARLPELVRRVRDLERRLEAIEQRTRESSPPDRESR